jgi:hypothetical protein
MSDLVSESFDPRLGDRHNSSHSTSDGNGGMATSARSYPTRPAASPVHAKSASSRLATDSATPHSDNSILSTSSVGEKSMDFIATDDKGQSQYIGKWHC